ncbi:MAG: pyridoxamine 5'-phosphate oxidase family protein [Rhizobiaceae bacterium]
MSRSFADITFTPSVLAEQTHNGSAEHYASFLDPDEASGNRIGPAEKQFISERDGFYQATVSGNGWPYVQFRGGPRGFLRVMDEQTIAYADYRGNRQYLSTGNLRDDDRVSLILMDYPNRRRLKVWGRAKLIGAKEDALLLTKVKDPDYRALPERIVVITIEALDWNCPQHIPQRLTVEEFDAQLKPIRIEMAQLRAENEALKAKLRESE